MRVRSADRKLARLEVEADCTAGFGLDVVKAFRRRMQQIRAAVDERLFYSLKSLHYEKLKGQRRHQRSMRLNDQFRLVVEIEATAPRTLVVVSIEDYH